MTFVDNAELPSRYIDQVHVHVLASQEEHTFSLSKLDRRHVLIGERTQIILLVEYALVSGPDSEVSVKTAGDDLVFLP